jgi:Zn-dependent protease with chaperone function
VVVSEDWVRDEIEQELVVERIGWAAERVARVTERLQRDVMGADRLQTLVLWMDEHTAFTVHGRTIYISRRLLERLADDDAVAFVIAHELAHHQLGHVINVPRSWLTALRWPLIWLQVVLITTNAREHDADLRAIERCVEAGYDAERCITALELLAQVSLDYGDVDGVLGAEDGMDWAASHPPLHARIAAVRAHLAAMQRGVRLPLEITIQRERQRRQKIAMIAATGVAALLAFVLL